MSEKTDFKIKGSALKPLIKANGPSRDPIEMLSGLWFLRVNSIEEVLIDQEESEDGEKEEQAYRHLVNNPKVVTLLDEWINFHVSSSNRQKMASKSVEYRTRGNQFYKSENFHEALAYYTFAIIYAPNVDELNSESCERRNVPEELSLAFGNRSAAFFELKQFESSLADLEHALATGYPRSGAKYNKMALRKIKCLVFLNRISDTKKALEQLSSSTEFNSLKKGDIKHLARIRAGLAKAEAESWKENEKVSKSFPNQPYNLTVIENLERSGRFESSSTIAPFSTKVKIVEDPIKGRAVVAREVIEPGELISVEAPYCQVIDDKWNFYMCHHCHRRLEDRYVDGSKDLFISISSVPCTSCTSVLYCSPECRSASWNSYHRYECSILPALQQMSNNSPYLAFRIVVSTGLEIIQAQQAKNLQNEKSTDPNRPIDLSDMAACYERICQLEDHEDQEKANNMSEFNINVALLVRLAKRCGFLQSDSGDELERFCGQTLMKHYLQICICAHAIAIPMFIGDGKGTIKMVHYGAAIYPFSGLFEHGCVPNVEFHQALYPPVLVQRVTKRVEAGGILKTEYQTNYAMNNCPERRKLLKANYFFWCECDRCVLECRDGFEDGAKYYPVVCDKCGSVFTRSSVNSDVFHCFNQNCSERKSRSKMEDLYARITKKLATVDELVKLFRTAPPGQPGLDEKRKTGGKLEAVISELLKLNAGMARYHKLLDAYYVLYRYQNISRSNPKMKHYYLQHLDLLEHAKGPSTRALADMYYHFCNLRTIGLDITANEMKRARELIRTYLLFEDEVADCPEGFALDDSSLLTSRMWQIDEMAQWGMDGNEEN